MPGADLALRAIVLLVAAWAAVALLRQASASLRAFVWTATLGGVLVLPIVSMFVPAWRIPILAPAPAIEISGSAHDAAAASASSSAASTTLSASHFSSPPRLVTSFPWRTIAVGIWMLGALSLLIRILASHVKLARIARRADAGADTMASQLSVEAGSAQICFTDEVAVPAVAGLFRPVLLLPPDAGSWTPELLRSVIRHELAHVRRRDPIGRLICQLACAVYWFVPLVWIGASRADALREQACDDEVLRSGVTASSYAASLIALVQQAGCAPIEPAALAMAAPSSIQERVMTILNPSVPRGAVTVRASLVLTFAVGSAVTLAASVLPVERAPQVTASSRAPATQSQPVAQTTVTSQTPVTPGTTVTPQTTVTSQTKVTPRTTVVSQTAQVTQTAQVPQTPQTTVTKLGICGSDITSTTRSASGSVSTSSSSSSSNSTSTTENNGRRTWNASLRGPQCSVELRIEGSIVFKGDHEVSSLSPDGLLSLDVTKDGVRRQLDIKPDRGSFVYTWRVDGREQPYDAAARAWFAKVMGELDKHPVAK